MIADDTMTISDGVEDVTFDIVAHVEEADYSWSAEAVLQRRPDGALFWFTDAGCSCFGFADSATTGDLQPIFTMAEAYKLSADRARLERSYRLGEIEWT